LFSKGSSSFLTLDADTVITGPILDEVISDNSQFIVDEEIQPFDRINEIYYKLDRIHEVNSQFQYPGYTFNEGQWFGTTGIIAREDFNLILDWKEPPVSKFPNILLQGAQGHLNFMLQLKEQKKELTITRQKIMIWPAESNAEFIDLKKIISKSNDYPYIIHWAGFKFNKYNELPRFDILSFYRNYYYSKLSLEQKIIDKSYNFWLILEKKATKIFKKLLKTISKRV